jgi:hypothetical protein
LTTGINDTAPVLNFATPFTGLFDTGGKIATGVNDTSGKQWD